MRRRSPQPLKQELGMLVAMCNREPSQDYRRMYLLNMFGWLGCEGFRCQEDW